MDSPADPEPENLIMPVTIDHIIVATKGPEHEALSQRLARAGFVRGDTADLDLGVSNEHVLFSSGAFLEVLHSSSEDGGPEEWFTETPRIQGIGFTTDDFDDTMASWGDPPHSWHGEFGGTVPDDAEGRGRKIRGAGPSKHVAEFYPFIMDRPSPSPAYQASGASATLTTITIRGKDPQLWREQFRERFRLQPADVGLTTDDGVTILFEQGNTSQPRPSLEFSVTQAPGSIEMPSGTISLKAYDE